MVGVSAVVNAVGVLATVLLIQGEHQLTAGVLTGIMFIAVAVLARGRRAAHMTVRALVIAGVASVAESRLDNEWITLGTMALLLLLVLAETVLLHLPDLVGYRAINLPTAPAGRPLMMSASLLFRSNLVLAVWFAVGCWLRLPSWVLLIPAVLASIALVVLGQRAIHAWRHRTDALSTLRKALVDYAPEFVLYFSGNAPSVQHISMWTPYLVRIRRPFVVIVRDPHTLAQLKRFSDGVPVVLCESVRALDAAVVDTIKAAFYVNNGTKNLHLLRFAQLHHVYLGHGDSDKPPSYSPVTALYDKVFVAGQAGRDRFTTHGVSIPDEKFVIVGRPQVEEIRPLGAQPKGTGQPTVLYAPTWRGQYEDSNFCSLPNAKQIVEALVSNGVRVIFRPHPFSRSERQSAAQIHEAEQVLARQNDRHTAAHLFGPKATALTIVESFNRSDALVSDVSSVVSDYLFSGKPFAVSDMLDEGPSFARTFPLATAAYVIPRALDGLNEAVAAMLGPDPLAGQRTEMRRYYLGDFPSEGYAEHFLEAARAVIDLPPKRAAGHVEHDGDGEKSAEPVPTRDGFDDD
jgi:hypothetical protein